MPAIHKVLTQYQTHAHTIADTFRAAFAGKKLGDCVAEMTAPEESTKGGLLGLQHVMLRMPNGLSHVVGTVNAGERRAELRPFEWLVRANRERLERDLGFDKASYDEFLERATSVLGAFGIEVAAPDAPPAPEPPMARASSARTIAIVLALVTFAAVAIWWIFVRRG